LRAEFVNDVEPINPQEAFFAVEGEEKKVREKITPGDQLDDKVKAGKSSS
jgi:hypothetical protein